MKKCLKCGNNVLPGTSTCPGCGNAIRNNTNTKQSFTPSAKRTVDYTPRRIHDTVSPNTAGYNSSANGSGIVAVIIVLILKGGFLLSDSAVILYLCLGQCLVG